MGKSKTPQLKSLDPSPHSRFEVVIADTIEFRKQNPKESFTKIAARFLLLSAETIRNRFNSRGSKSNSSGHNKLLLDVEELAIIEIIDQYTFISTLLRLDLLRSIATSTLRKRGVADLYVGKH
jgi:hypothetical protein